jgi:threonine-phosphate decarboxylase
MKQFEHGGDIVSFASSCGCEVKEVIDLSSNINFIKPEITLDFNSLDISAYPNYDELYEKLSKLYNIETSELEIYNGASSSIFSLFREFNTRHCYIYSPAYLEYKKAASIYGYTCEYINRFTSINQYILPNSLVIFVNPSTPDGNFYDIDILMKKWMEKNCTVLVDESFLDFCHDSIYKTVTPYIKKYKKLYVLKSMTKFYSSAGIRVGCIISDKQNIESLKQKEPLWKISQFDSFYIKNVLDDKNFEKISKAVNIKNKEALTKILESSKYIQKVFPSVANFVMVQLKGIDASSFQELLKPYKIMVRDCSNFDFLDASFIRIAVKGQKSLEALEKALKDL